MRHGRRSNNTWAGSLESWLADSPLVEIEFESP
jgi:hypothetical protein